MEIFNLENRDYIELNKLLKIMRWVETGGEANLCIDNGEVLVNGDVETRRRNKLRKGYVVSFLDQSVQIE